MANVQDFIKTYMDINQLMLQKQELALAEENARIARLGAVQAIGQQLYDRGAIGDLSRLYGNSSGGDITSILEGSAPGPGVTQRGVVQEGLDRSTPDARRRLADEALTRETTGVGNYQLNTESFMDSLLSKYNPTDEMKRRLAEGLASRTATGMGAGQLALSSVAAGLPQAELEEGAGIGMGTRASAGEVLGSVGQAAAIRAQESGNALDWDIANRNLQLARERAVNGQDTDSPSWLDPKWQSEQITAISKELAGTPDMPPAIVDMKQRQIFSMLMAGKGNPLDPYADVPSPRRQGESNEAYNKRASEELANLMVSLTGKPMNPRTILGWIASMLPGGGR